MASYSGGPAENIILLREAGLPGICAPKEFGGGGRSELDALLVLDAIASVWPTTAAAMNVFDVGPLSIITKHGSTEARKPGSTEARKPGSPDQQERCIPRMLSGELRLSIALTEPEAGSELMGLSTSGQIDGSEVVLNGRIVFSGGADAASIFLVDVRFGPKLSDIRAVIVEKVSPGLVLGPTRTFIVRFHMAELPFEECRVPAANILPLENGFKEPQRSARGQPGTHHAERHTGSRRLRVDGRRRDAP
ncbi:acyl-CoA dehydrogenase family protein [Arthrobacter sp. 2MCAF14]|uniref:acyl-CoA dehydrogenase family protein n=1 Tax=Arthrobacter sp. 2MCAF14 TaxID=3232982 RepID=UPI003F93AADC